MTDNAPKGYIFVYPEGMTYGVSQNDVDMFFSTIFVFHVLAKVILLFPQMSK